MADVGDVVDVVEVVVQHCLALLGVAVQQIVFGFDGAPDVHPAHEDHEVDLVEDFLSRLGDGQVRVSHDGAGVVDGAAKLRLARRVALHDGGDDVRHVRGESGFEVGRVVGRPDARRALQDDLDNLGDRVLHYHERLLEHLLVLVRARPKCDKVGVLLHIRHRHHEEGDLLLEEFEGEVGVELAVGEAHARLQVGVKEELGR